jgi:hypothetical protein
MSATHEKPNPTNWADCVETIGFFILIGFLCFLFWSCQREQLRSSKTETQTTKDHP